MSRASESDDAFDDLLWELDVTSVRPRPAASDRRADAPHPRTRARWTHAPSADPPPVQPLLVDPSSVQPRSVQPRSVQPRSVQPRAPRPAPRRSLFARRERPRFQRPGLHSLGERLAASRVVQGAGAALLVGGTSVLVVVALSRG
ncbi:MAG: hypothetical protein EPO52_08040 [Herbiconiux sp.]|uniref:hypothetical protein n=1 Tax=Herbiconiux sp. TaxID=1871186 RepID=UPI001223706A|nr:hypothetical protein [Herbiconiux sp.]TAJ48117.1 MAG: hypothetical protein EPO52_08040 [Herbiconiux sp.]